MRRMPRRRTSPNISLKQLVDPLDLPPLESGSHTRFALGYCRRVRHDRTGWPLAADAGVRGDCFSREFFDSHGPSLAQKRLPCRAEPGPSVGRAAPFLDPARRLHASASVKPAGTPLPGVRREDEEGADRDADGHARWRDVDGPESRTLV